MDSTICIEVQRLGCFLRHHLERVMQYVYCRMSMSANDLEIHQNPGVCSMVVYRRLAALLSKL